MAKLLIYDERLAGSPPWKEVSATCLVNDKHRMEDIVGWVRKKCKKYKGEETLYIMAHGDKGRIQLGKDGLGEKNVHLWSLLEWKLFRIIVMSCSVGGGNEGGSFCSKLASCTRSYVTAAESKQNYIYLPWGILPTSFGSWEGKVNTWNQLGWWVGTYVEPEYKPEYPMF
jgi:hypothetical protein